MDKSSSTRLIKRDNLPPLLLSIVFLVIGLGFLLVPGLEKSILVAHNPVYYNGILFGFLSFITDAGIPVILSVYAVLLYSELRNGGENTRLFLIIFFALFIAGAAGDILKLIVGRERPVTELAGLIERVKPFKTLSFPSGHATKSMALVFPFLTIPAVKIRFINPLRAFVLFAGVLVAYSRIALQAHFPSDVMGGIAVAILFLPVAVFTADLVIRKNFRKKDGDQFLKKMVLIVFVIIIIGLMIF